MSCAATSADKAAIALRIIDCCLREEIRGKLPSGLSSHWPGAPVEHWLCIAHLGSAELWLPLGRGAPLQAWSAASDSWLRHWQGQVWIEQGYALWLEHLGQGLDSASLTLFAAYRDEADCAAVHRGLCREAYREHASRLTDILDEGTWGERLLGIDRLASYLDHPFYPTARAKNGFDPHALRRYAPEFAPRFALNWLAVPKSELSLSSAPPVSWPSFADLGLDDELAVSHQLIPVHPLTWPTIERYGLPAGSIKAPRNALLVEPTLSVRTVACVDDPHCHIKLPLLVRTLGACNLRLVKPSTLYDGYWFQTILEALAERDPALSQRYLHVDEQHGGHAGEHSHLAYIVRRYPAELDEATLVPVAALASPLEDGRLFLEALVKRFYAGDLLAWLGDYLDLLLQVHLRLWLQYGIALEANQQNAVLILQSGQSMRLLMKDNDSARLWPERFAQACPDFASRPAALRDARIRVASTRPLAEMFCTITLQLNMVAPMEAISSAGLAPRESLYQILRQRVIACIAQLESEGLDCLDARRFLLDSPTLPVKYLLSAGSLFSKAQSGAEDINKYYGYSAANFLLGAPLCRAN
jgi:siderophore synthetase component